MGYTHHWCRASKLPTAAFKAFVGDVNALAEVMSANGITLAGGVGAGEPEINNKQIWINGASPDDHETFFIDRVFRGESWELPDSKGRYYVFCKTNRKPYDLMVVASLFAARYRFGDDFVFSSDGYPAELQVGYDLWIKTCHPVNPPALTDLLEKK